MSGCGTIILHCPAGGGHRAAAQALAEAHQRLDAATPCEVLDALAFTPPWFAQGLVGAHLTSTARAPALYGLSYAAFDHRHVLTALRSLGDRAIGDRLRRAIIAKNPEIVIATHYFPLAVLAAARRGGELAAPLVGVVTDYAAHAFWAERGVDAFCAPPGRACADLVRHGIPGERIVPTGIPVRPAFGRIPPLLAPATGERLRVLVTSGGFGIGPIAAVLRSFARLGERASEAVELTVVCGHGEQRRVEAARVATALGLRAEIVGFEPEMARRMAWAHVVVGKPGGLTVSETLAAGRPMVLVGGIPGQELDNQRWLVRNGAGVAARPRDVGRLVAELAEAGQLVPMARAARRLGRPHAAEAVLEVAWRLAGAPLATAA